SVNIARFAIYHRDVADGLNHPNGSGAHGCGDPADARVVRLDSAGDAANSRPSREERAWLDGRREVRDIAAYAGREAWRPHKTHYSAERIALLREGRIRYKTGCWIHSGREALMDEQQLRRLKPELDRFLERYAWLFDVNEMHARRMVQGLLRVGE